MRESLLVESGALRQFRHNDDDAFVFGYDLQEADLLVAKLVAKNKEMQDFLQHLQRMILQGCVYLGDSNHVELYRLLSTKDL